MNSVPATLAGTELRFPVQSRLRRFGAMTARKREVIMSDMSGRRMADFVIEQFGTKRVAYISGYDNTALSQHGVLEAGIRLIQKPFLNEALVRFVREALDGA